MRQKKYLKDDWEVLKNNKTTDLKYSKHKQKKTRTKKSIINRRKPNCWKFSKTILKTVKETHIT